MIGENILIVGPAGSGKTHKAKHMVCEKSFLLLNMSENSSYDNLVEGIQISVDNDTISYNEKEQAVLNFIYKAMADKHEEYFLILDDINRVNLSATLGELFFALKNRECSITLKSGRKIYAPNNITVIATSNSSDIHSGNNLINYELFDRITHMNNDLMDFEAALDEMKRKNICSVSNTEYAEIKESLINEYKRYLTEFCIFSREYKQFERELKLGFTYFLPSEAAPVIRWQECVQHKIRHQVRPLLSKYAEDGIIKKEYIPKSNVNDTEYVSRRISEEKIEIDTNHFVDSQELREYEISVFDNGAPLPIGAKKRRNGSLKVSWQYVIIATVLREMIEYSLINQHDLLDLLTRDSQILTFRNDVTAPNGQVGGCLLVEEDIAPYFPTRDSASGNNGSYSYSENCHIFKFDGKNYRMFSAYSASNRVNCNYELTRCIQTGKGSQKRKLYPTIKMLVYKYFKRYETNLRQILLEGPNADIERRLKILEEDILLVSQITDDVKYSGKEYYMPLDNQNGKKIVEFIRNLETWKSMKIDYGVYRIMSTEYKKIMNITNVKQMILQGPPGTSKTYGAKKFISEEIGITSDEWEKELDTYQLTTLNDEYVAPEPGKKVYWDIVQFHPSYTYEDFVRGITVFPKESGIIKGKITKGNEAYDVAIDSNNAIAYKSVNKAMGKISKIAAEHYEEAKANGTLVDCPSFYLVIDEINRANLATVFGELIYAFEYRDKGIKTPYLVNGNDSLVIPPNLYIIGTMNTADKSIGTVDYAIRRRFLFFKLLPSVNIVVNSVLQHNPSSDVKESHEVKLFYLINVLFENCLNDMDYEQEDVQLGHTYFLRKTDNEGEAAEQAKYRFIYQVLPIIFEYKKDGIIDLTKTSNEENPSVESALNKLVELVDAKDSKREELYIELLEVLGKTEMQAEISTFIEENRDDN